MSAFHTDVLSVVGARPQFVKLAPVARALRAAPGVRHRVVHTGQHYDERMSAVFFEQLGLPRPELDLGVGSGTHGAQTAAMLSAFERCLHERRPSVVLVYGDTNSTLAATLAATKLNVPIAHVEAGLRSFDRTMPEEINRVATDHCSDRLYAPTPLAMDNLEREHLAERACLSGDVMRDAVVSGHAAAADAAAGGSGALERLGLEEGGFALLTLHRAANTTPDTLSALLEGLSALASARLPIVFPIHPRTRAVLGDAIDRLPAALRIVEPLPYFDLLEVLSAAALALTDSGGLQKEAAFLRTPCITLREETEWVETVDMGVNRLVGRDLDKLGEAFERYAGGDDPFTEAVASEMDRHYGTGEAAPRLCEDLLAWSNRAGEER